MAEIIAWDCPHCRGRHTVDFPYCPALGRIPRAPFRDLSDFATAVLLGVVAGIICLCIGSVFIAFWRLSPSVFTVWVVSLLSVAVFGFEVGRFLERNH